ncbi:succinate dehydrogenase cytochrome b subunit [Geotalea uraniireducens]|nr:succinate dehydrogenase cytochrome b subunit [Geotalea uraniireducens]
MQLLTSNVGRKVLMAITGQFLVLFIVIHMLGNSSIFIPGGINAYAEHLHSLPPLVWGFRGIILVVAAIHIIFGVQLSLENRAANADSYAVKNLKRATLSSLSMLYTGLLLLTFIIYHLLQFTIHATPDVVMGIDAQGRPDVFHMVVGSFQHGIIAFIYIAAMVTLFMHLAHGIQSFFQTMGWNNDKTLPVIGKIGKVVAVVLLLGYASIPLFIVSGILKG